MQTEREEIMEVLRQRLRSHRTLLIKRMSGVWPEINNDQFVVDNADSDVPAMVEFQLTERTLQRIREGTFGLCETCGREIAGERLEVLPFAKICIKCQLEEASGIVDSRSN